MAPLVLLCYFIPGWGALLALVLYIIAAVSDYIDGYLARRYNSVSRFGAFLDPVADKILVLLVLMLLLADPEPLFSRAVLAVLAALIIMRELVQSSLRDWMSQAGRTKDVSVSGMSKTKTGFQLVGLGVMLGVQALAQLLALLEVEAELAKQLVDWLAILGLGLLTVAAVLGIISLARFLQIAFSKQV